MRFRFPNAWLLLIFTPLVQAAENGQFIEQQMSHQQEQEKARYNQLETVGKDVRSSGGVGLNTRIDFPDEHPCFNIQHIDLNKSDQIPHWIPLRKLTEQAQGRCLGIQGIKTLATALQNRLIEHGYITTRVLIPQQNLTEGELTLDILSGTIGNVKLTDDSDKYVNLHTTFPGSQGDLLDLRAIEQGLENMQRIPNVAANISLQPGKNAGESDLEITRKQPSFWRVGGWLDDSGSKQTGRYQSGLALYIDNPTAMNDLFYVSAGRDLQFQSSRYSNNGSLYYSVPYGFWSLDLYAGRSEYLQTINGIYTDFSYRGKYRNLSLKVNRLLYRNATQKNTLHFQVLKRNSHFYLNDTELQLQKRNMTNWSIGLNHRHYIGQSIVDAMVTYQRDTSWFGAQKPIDSGPASRIVNLDLSTHTPFTLKDLSLSYQSRFRQQYSPDRLTTQDQFSIGNRWSVRGFDGEMNMMANKGYFLRNDLNLNLPKMNQQLYVGVDYGKVKGEGSNDFASGHLLGSVAGIRGGIKAFSYDAFVGVPLSKPDNFITSPVTVGFTLQWQF
ncbi:hemolysin activation/secretion protein [Serratia fonticola]|uniref:Hemolysin activation/secretion protein n=1 Tax=Serratia fonticola TaxID=47917 RepID=A0A542D090_SERFO|nr:ShlB/FhaC/HecB family hemolysin secretion/activation protein [Serratia fonticola]TQI81487.1 hemolysin activation/secretion protein [Serratia fonticola]TQI96489.1 hemolysin activation/secretion protein [Serratia fonticola]TVZ70986.1 hemolysin activation/secretion protein [Serratia fonticola]